MTYYALQLDNKFMFNCVSSSEKELEKRIESAYWSWRGMQPQGTNPTKEEFMIDQTKVKITIEPIESKL